MLLILVGHRIAMLTVIQSHKVTLSNKAYSPGWQTANDRPINTTRNINSLRKSTAVDILADIRIDGKFSKNLEEANICFLEWNKVPLGNKDV